MFELAEMTVLANQVNDTLTGKTIKGGVRGNSPHKFVWYNCQPDEFESLITGKTMGQAIVRGRWLFISLEPGYVLVFGECGGKILYHKKGDKLPAKHHLLINYSDDTALSVKFGMWGAVEVYPAGQELERQYVKDMNPVPLSAAFTEDYFNNLLDTCIKKGKRSVKSLLVQEQTIPGLGNACAQDIMFNARLHPRHNIADLTASQRQDLFVAINDTVTAILAQGGRNDETDLFGQPGGYQRIMDKNALNKPCPACGGKVQKISYLGGACYLCPQCQK